MFDPTKSLLDDVRILDQALIVPQGQARARGIAVPAGIYDSNGTYQDVGQCWRNSRVATTFQPDELPAGSYAKRRGTWIFGGILYNHFGHALLESTARLWVRNFAPDAKGVLFLLKKNVTRERQFIRPMEPMLAMFGGEIGKVKPVSQPTQVDRLVIAPQGFGTGDMIAGCPEFRDHLQRTLADRVKPEGAEKVYISRSQLYAKRGRYLAEDLIEAHLKAEGYRIFHPQNHPLEEQAAQYAAARMVISSDSSALHLAAFFTHPGSRLAIVLRRPGTVLEDYLTQYRSFAAIEPDVIDALTGQYFQFSGAKLSQFSELYSELDLPRLGQMLSEAGYIRDPSVWNAPQAEQLEEERRQLSERLGQPIVAAAIPA